MTPAVPSSSVAPLQLTPGFGSALRGVWLLTWRNLCAWRSLGGAFAAMLALPLLAYLIGAPPPPHRNFVGDPSRDFARFAHSLARHETPLTIDQSNQLSVIFNEEYARFQDTQPPSGANIADESKFRVEQVREWNRSILDRSENVLEPAQFDRLKNLQKNMVTVSTQEASRVRWSASDAFYHLLVDFYFFLVLPLACVRSSGALIRDELQADTLGFLTTRPISRAALTIVKYIPLTAFLMLMLLIQTGLLFAAGAARHIPELTNVFCLLLLAQILAVPAWSALGLLLGLFTKRYIAAALVYGFVVELGIGRIPSNINSLSLMRHLKTLLANNATLRDRFEWTDQAIFVPVLALVLATGVFLGLSAVLFNFREYNQDAEMQK